MAVTDAPAHFRTAARGYDRSAVDAVVRAEQALLLRCNQRIAMLQHRLATPRLAALRVDDPERKQAIRVAAELVCQAWDHARQLLNAEDEAADRQRAHAASVAAGHLAGVSARAEEQERHTRARAEAMLAAAHEEADRLRIHAGALHSNAEPAAEQLLAESAEKSRELALAAEIEMQMRRQAVDTDLTQRQIAADSALQAAEQLAAQHAQEAGAIIEQAARARATLLDRARATAHTLTNAVPAQIAALEAEAELALAALAEHLATLNTHITSAGPGRTPPPVRESVSG